MGISVPVWGRRRVRRRMPAWPCPAPLRVLVPAAAGLLSVALPLGGLLLAGLAAWDAAPDGMGAAVRLSLLTSSIATLGCLATGVPLAWMLARGDFRGRAAVRTLVLAPLVLPPAAAGVALLTVLGPGGVLGRWPSTVLGVTISPTAAMVTAQAFTALPFLVLCAEGTFRAADPRLAETAQALGATRGTALRRVTLPLTAPGLAAATALCWLRSLGEAAAVTTVTQGLAHPAAPVPGGALPGGAVPGGAVPGGAVPGGAVPGGAVPGGHAGSAAVTSDGLLGAVPPGSVLAVTPGVVLVLGPVLLVLTAVVLWGLRGRWVCPS
ncbi:ABC transporter permease subunit [Sphaerisporangium sp. B11E5]|uniref:ABC transporter permease n=1 Tax=Sphaerisporangium sp. B11E5 TaxID=3153563 RepID=UPI00325F4E16